MKHTLVFLSILLVFGCTQQTSSFVEPAETKQSLEVSKQIKAAAPEQKNVRKDFVSAEQIPILMYHYIGEVPKNDLHWGMRNDLTVSRENFEKQLEWLVDHEYQTVSFAEASRIISEKDFFLTQKSIVLTFDDGYKDAYTEAFPLLQKYGFVGTFAVFPEAIGRDGYLTKDDILAMDKAGMEFVSHSMSHPSLTNVAQEKLEREVKESKRILEEWLGKDVNGFVYPSGQFDPRVQKALKNAGYTHARTTFFGFLNRKSDGFAIPTIRIRGGTTMENFEKFITSQSPRVD